MRLPSVEAGAEMTRAPWMRGCLAGLACAVALVVAGCGLGEREPPSCRAGIPSQQDLLGLPAFAPLTFHRRSTFDASRGAGFDLWADAKFEYKSALEFSHVPARNASAGARFCVDALSVKLALPMDEPRREMLRSFVKKVLGGTASAERLQAQLDELVAKKEKYRPIATEAGVSVEAGTLSHPNRGELFVVAFIWQ